MLISDLNSEISWMLGMEGLRAASSQGHTPSEINFLGYIRESMRVQLSGFSTKKDVFTPFEITDGADINGKAWRRYVQDSEIRLSIVTAGALLGPSNFFTI